MTDQKETEHLALVEPAGALWKRIRDRLAELRQSEEGTAQQEWMMGGGSILAARWAHRTSTDIDLITSAQWQLRDLGASGTNAFTRAMTALGGKLKGFNDASIEMTFPDRQRLHIFRHQPTPALGHRRATIDGQAFIALSTTQILAGKLLHRSLRAPARDLYDIVLASEREPAGLHHSVNMLSPEMRANITLMWYVRQEKLERDARVTLKPISERNGLSIERADLVNRAIEATEAAGYQQIRVIPARAGQPAAIVTATADGRATPIAVPHVVLDEVLERSGMNQCLAARRMDRERFITSLHTEREATRGAPSEE